MCMTVGLSIDPKINEWHRWVMLSCSHLFFCHRWPVTDELLDSTSLLHRSATNEDALFHCHANEVVECSITLSSCFFLAFIDWHLLPKIQQDGSFFPMQPMWKRCSSTGNGWLGYVSEGKDNKGKLVQLSFLLHLWGGVDSHWLMVRKNRNHINFLQENPTQPPERAFGSTIFSSKCIRLDLLPMSRIFDNWKAVWESIQFQWGRWQDQRWMCKWHKNTVHVLALCKFQEWIMPCGRKQISTTRDRSLSTHLLLSHKPKQMTSSNHLHPQQGRDLG